MRYSAMVLGLVLAGLPAGLPTWAENFTTAAEVRPILKATKASWLALREYEGQDLLYFTHLISWRCGLSAVRYSINGGEEQLWDLEPCYEADPAPNAMKAADRLPYIVFDLQSVDTVSVSLDYDDGESEGAEFSRGAILMP